MKPPKMILVRKNLAKSIFCQNSLYLHFKILQLRLYIKNKFQERYVVQVIRKLGYSYTSIVRKKSRMEYNIQTKTWFFRLRHCDFCCIIFPQCRYRFLEENALYHEIPLLERMKGFSLSHHHISDNKQRKRECSRLVLQLSSSSRATYHENCLHEVLHVNIK